MKTVLVLAMTALTLCLQTGCGKSSQFGVATGNLDAVSAQAAEQVGCTGFESSLWDVAYAQVLQAGPNTPSLQNSLQDVTSSVQAQIQSLKISSQAKSALAQEVQNFYQILQLSQAQQMDTSAQLQYLTRAEIGSATTDDAVVQQQKLQTWRSELQSTLSNFGVQCAQVQISDPLTTGTSGTQNSSSQTGTAPTPSSTSGVAPAPSPKPTSSPSTPVSNPAPAPGSAPAPAPIKQQPQPPAPSTPPSPTHNYPSELGQRLTLGARTTMTVAYQSCDVDQKAPMTSATPSIKGLSQNGRSSNGGEIRSISNLQDLVSSDYYLTNLKPGSSCKDIRKTPMLYNFGGKPNVVTGAGGADVLDLFSRGKEGKGDSAFLGVDCSGYLFASAAVAGLKLAPDKPMKPVFVYGLDSFMFMDPEKNGLTCFAKISMGVDGTLRAGDVVAQSGHVLMIASVGADPLAITKARTESDCDKITTKDFDFTVIQSSSDKNGIGINKYVGADFLNGDPQVGKGLLDYAQQSCVARLHQQNVAVHSTLIQASRYKDDPNCTQEPIHLQGESCVASCRAIP